MRSGGGLGAVALLALCACASTPRAVTSRPAAPATRAPAARAHAGDDGREGSGVVHVVRRGQNLFRIARAYGVEVSVLMETNGITDPRTVAVGEELFVPGATEVLDVEPAPGEPPPRLPEPLPARAGPASARPALAPARTAPPAEPAAMVTPPPAAAPLAWPLKGVLYSRYGARGKARHDGIDISAPQGSPVMAADDGTVLFVGTQSGYGKVVILRHEHNVVTVYAHNSEVLVREGERVSRGQPISRVGQTGRTTGPHLHFEVREGVKPRNPLLYLP